MTRGRLLIIATTLAAILGGLAFVSGEGAIAALGGLCAIAVASLASRGLGERGEMPRRRRRDAAAPVVEQPADETPTATRPAAATGPLTADGVLNEEFLAVTLTNRVAVARRALRPLSIIHLEILDVDGDRVERVADGVVTAALAATLRESDVVGRRSDGIYVFVLEDTAEDGAVWTAERMRRGLASRGDERRFRAGIASYPSHGLDAPAIEAKAAAALSVAREWKRDRIEVATGG